MLAAGAATPRSILRATPFSDVGNLLPRGGSVQDGDFVMGEANQNSCDGSINPTVDEEDRAPTPKPKRAKKQVRILLDARTELTDKELKDARDNYLVEQTRLHLALDEQRLNKEAAERAQDLLREPPVMCE